MPVSLEPIDGGLALTSPFHRELVDGIKALPYASRKWDQARRQWIIAHEVAPVVQRLVREHLGVTLTIPTARAAAGPTLQMVRVEYIGRSKARNDDVTDPLHSTASGYVDGRVALVFPEAVLRRWFDAEPVAGDERAGPKTLYQVLTVKQSATPDEIKRAYRQLARQWHPDVCRERDAHEQFLRIKAAYDVLGDEKARKRYNAGLVLEASQDTLRPFGRPKNMAVSRHDDDTYGYRAPLRCGLILLEGVAKVGQVLVSNILKWDDVIDDLGRTMVASWPLDGKTYEVRWV